MNEREQTARFLRMEKAAPGLYSAFNALTRAHTWFQGPGALRSISVSDVLDNGSIEATFQGVRIKFEPLLMLGPDRSPRVRSCACNAMPPTACLPRNRWVRSPMAKMA
ncbi:hypothetical protein LP419_02590 [Massilia sp. H-1]|nr:hypothetical protein LP419_02590 [Massilia sp. H-1]